jgi:Fungal chitosanase of glycosyl hydrolase group 75
VGTFAIGFASVAIPAVKQAGASSDSPQGCPRSPLLNFQATLDGRTRVVSVWQEPEGSAFFFEDGMTIDADGAPNTYNPDNTGLDDLSMAGAPGHWEALAVDESGEPYIQGPDDPYPGYYVSMTALADRTKKPNDPKRYLDASKIPYIVLPREVIAQSGARLGDFTVVLNVRNGKISNAIFGDIGTMGEGSVALADRLGIWSDARNGGARGGIFYLVFAGSGNGKPRTNDEIEEQATGLLQAWGGTERLLSCSEN